MKITIDTKEDSHEDIRKIIALLSRMIESEQPRNIFESSGNVLPGMNQESSSEPTSSEQTNAFANMFGDNTPTKSEETSEEDKEEPEDVEVMEY